LRVGQAGERIDEHLDDLLGRAVRHFLDVHAAFAGGDERDLLGAPIGDHGHVVFLLDVGAVFDVQAVDLLAVGAGLVGLELHAQDVTGQTLDVVDGLGDLDATALAAATRVDLGLHDPHRAAQLLSRSHGFVNGKCRDASWDRHAKSAQDLFALVLVDFHVKTRSLLCGVRSCRT